LTIAAAHHFAKLTFCVSLPQVLLPPSGARLVLASDGVWSLATERLLRAMHAAPLKTAAHEVIKHISTGRTSSVDAAIIVADMLPPGSDFPSLCKRTAATAAEAAAAQRPLQRQRSGGKGLLGLLGLGRSRSGKRLAPAPDEAAAAALAPPHAPPTAPTFLADFDSAAPLGLMPPASLESSRSGSPSVSRSSSSTALAAAAAAAREAVAAAAGGAAREAGLEPQQSCRRQQQAQPPAWFDEEAELQLHATLVRRCACCGRGRSGCCCGPLLDCKCRTARRV
jgi:hypothetical protein